MTSESKDKKQTGDHKAKKTSEPISEAERIEEKIDRDLRHSFPASDPPGWTLGVKKNRPKKDKA